jgi:type IV pilus assembly protein PilC
MAVWVYTARDQSGNVSTGTVEAPSDSRAAAELRAKGLWVTDLRAAGRARKEGIPADAEKSLAKQVFNPVSLKDLSLFYRQLYTLLNSGMGVYQSIESLCDGRQTPNGSLRRVVREIAPRILAGGRLSEGMARFPWLFDRMQVRLVEAGESGGLLVEVLRRLAEYLEREYELRLEIKRKTLYPKLLLLAFLFIPPIPTLVFRGTGAYFLEIWSTIGWILIAGIPLLLALRVLLKTQGGRMFYDQVKMVLPVIGPLVRKLAVARFARSLAALYGAGVPIASSLAMSGESCGNTILERASLRMVPAVERGLSIAQALTAANVFQPMFLGMVSTGETSGNLDDSLNKAAEFYEEEAMHATVQLVVILGVVLLLVMAIVIGAKVVSFYGAHYSPGGMGGGALE